MLGAGLLPVVDALVFQYRTEVAGARFGLVLVVPGTCYHECVS